MKKNYLLTFLWLFIGTAFSFAHDSSVHHHSLKTWNLKNKEEIKASFLFISDDIVSLEDDKGKIQTVPLSDFSLNDQYYLYQKKEQLARLNSPAFLQDPLKESSSSQGPFLLILSLMLSGILYISYLKRFRYLGLATLIAGLFLFYGFHDLSAPPSGVATNPKSIDSAFLAFKPNVATWWNSTYFYVESTGIPTTHSMMTGISSWQQQVPVPQCYKGTNAWSIPLNPVIATTPVPVNSIHFIRGALALAVNGIPIFNPYTNTGVDAFLDGQLDKWGGHCGRADDYHYHTAPLHLYDKQSKTLPIAYALDGFAVYGTLEPDGKTMTTLDANHGHYYNGVL